MEKELKPKCKAIDLLDAVENVVEQAKDSKLSESFYKDCAPYIDYLCERLDLTPTQSVLVALFIDVSNYSWVKISKFAEYVDCRLPRILRYLKDAEELERRGFIYCIRRNKEISYTVPMEVVEAFQRDEKLKPKDYRGMSTLNLFEEIGNQFGLRDDNILTFNQLVSKIHIIFDSNPNLHFVREIRSLNLPTETEMLLVLFSHLLVNNNDNHVGYHDIDFMFDSNRTWHRVKGELNQGTHSLIKNKFIEYTNDNGFVNRESFRMTRQARSELLRDVALPPAGENYKQIGLKSSTDIPVKKLFFSPEVNSQVDDLTKLLRKKEFNRVCERLTESGFRKGFTALFYGSPGTGKTEASLQIARATGRDIMQVDVSKLKSMWVGESEKNVKALFDNYRAMAQGRSITPILLFNEADAIIGNRMDGADRAVEKMENSLQNIILQEMENLEGILIATTNLVRNLDNAFERRFLYKIKFEKPNIEARASIWKSMIPSLKRKFCKQLAEKFDFSGGEIENIARHYVIDLVLHGKPENLLQSIVNHCEHERLERNYGNRIGF